MKININIILLLFMICIAFENVFATQNKNSDTIIDSRIYLNIKDTLLPTFDDVYNSYKRKNNNLTIKEFERRLINCMNRLYDSIMSDTNKAYYQLLTIDNLVRSLDYSNYFNENIEMMLLKLYNSNYYKLRNISAIMLFKYSSNWFQLAKNVIDSAATKYNDIEYYLCIELRDKMKNTNSPPSDSLVYMCYYMMSKRWDAVDEIDEAFAEKNKQYANSYQRLEFYKKIDSVLVARDLREKKKYGGKNPNPNMSKYDELFPDAYKIYQMLKNRRNLKNYTPPVLDSKK